MSTANLLRFGAFELDSKAGELHRNGDLIHLAPQPFKVLALLIERSGEDAELVREDAALEDGHAAML